MIRDRRHGTATRVSTRCRVLTAVAGFTMLMTLAVHAPESARAVVPPVRDRTSRTVTADALPTVQINGVVWAQVMIGNTVYAGGEFTAARPAGAAAGVQETGRKNLLAYDITTGKLDTKFVPGSFNGQVRALAVSADKKTLFVGGAFTRVGSAKRGRFAALNVKTGALKSHKPAFNGTIYALAVNSKTVFSGGNFTAVGSKARSRLSAVSAKSGKLASWAAKANSTVKALVLTSGSKLLVVGGHFTRLNSTSASGSGAVSPTNGKTKTWKINKIVKNGSKASAVLSLATDGKTVYGAGYTYGGGNFEGIYAASSKDGAVRWLQDCHGDQYGVAPIGDVIYSVGHAHYCANIGGFPEEGTRVYQYALAVTKSAAGTVAKNGQTSAKTYTNFEGNPAPSLLNWFPQFSPGSYTGMNQAAWSVVGNSKYLSFGGEFPKVDGEPQQGLVRMAIPSLAPNKVGPIGGNSALSLKAVPEAGQGVVVSWGQLWDRDDLRLTYRLSRNGTVVDSRTVSVPFWQRSRMSFIDTEADDSPVEYQVTVSDAAGNSVTSSTVRVEPAT